MTPQEKAKQLVNGFYQPLGHLKCGVNNLIMWERAKKYALICVDEILNTCVESMIYYWQEVKTEIEKL